MSRKLLQGGGLDEGAVAKEAKGAGRRAREPKLARRVAQRIAAEIFDEGLEPGTRLPSERELQENFMVSRGTLREAMRILEVQGLVTMKVGYEGGPVVAQVSSLDLARATLLHFNALNATYREVWQARLLIEPMLAAAAAERNDEPEADRLGGALEPSGPNGEGGEDGFEFHRALCQASGNRVLNLVATTLSEVSYALLTQPDSVAPDWREQVVEEHRAVADAVKRGDGPAASAAMRAHMENVLENWEAQYRTQLDETVSVRHEI